MPSVEEGRTERWSAALLCRGDTGSKNSCSFLQKTKSYGWCIADLHAPCSYSLGVGQSTWTGARRSEYTGKLINKCKRVQPGTESHSRAEPIELYHQTRQYHLDTGAQDSENRELLWSSIQSTQKRLVQRIFPLSLYLWSLVKLLLYVNLHGPPQSFFKTGDELMFAVGKELADGLCIQPFWPPLLLRLGVSVVWNGFSIFEPTSPQKTSYFLLLVWRPGFTLVMGRRVEA